MGNFIAKFPGILLLIALSGASTWAQSSAFGSEDVQQELEKVQVLGSALMIAAHPDDENTAVLAWLARGRHVRTGYLSLTRGEGGQNLIGSEQGDALGVIRTEELLDARRIDGAEQFFSRAIDFGFSKSPKEAISKWGHDEILSDIVWVIRRFQPDVVILRFSGTPRDGHGHHQASAILGKEAFEAAGDPARFSEQLKWVQPWKAKRLVWNAFAFTPEQRKETESNPQRIQVDTGAFNPVLGRSYAEIAGISRSQHRSQGMGVPLQRGPELDYFLPVEGDAAKKDLFDGIDTSWSRLEDGKAVGELLAQAEAAYSAEHPERILPQLAEARRRIAGLADHNLSWAEQKLPSIDHLLALCSGLWIDAATDKASATPGDSIKVTFTALKRLPGPVRWDGYTITGLTVDHYYDVTTALEDDKPLMRDVKVDVPAAAPYSQPFWLAEPHKADRYTISDQLLIGRPDPIPVLRAWLVLEIAGTKLHLETPVHFRYVDHVRGELLRPLEIVPAVAANLPERAVIFPNGEPRRILVQVRANVAAAAGDVKLEVPDGWKVQGAATAFQLDSVGDQSDIAFTVTPPAHADGVRAQFRAVAEVKGKQIATGMESIDYEHIPPQVIFWPSSGALQAAEVRVLAKNVGYVMGAGDSVPDAIRQMGCMVTLLSETDLQRGDLSHYDAIVTGIRAYNVRADLRAAEPRLLDYVHNGGTLVVQYNILESNRFFDKPKQPGPLSPYPLEVSHDRVTDEESPMVIVDPKSPLLTTPNAIGPEDFNGWIQERGLYFANKWDPHYSTVLATHDPGEENLPGGELFTRYGKGVYVFTAYSWFRELPAGVPGAYRLFANLLSAGSATAATARKPE